MSRKKRHKKYLFKKFKFYDIALKFVKKQSLLTLLLKTQGLINFLFDFSWQKTKRTFKTSNNRKTSEFSKKKRNLMMFANLKKYFRNVVRKRNG